MTPGEYGRELARRHLADRPPTPERIEQMVRVYCAIEREREAA